MSRRSWFGSFFGEPEAEPVDRFSIEHLRALRDVLVNQSVISDSNREQVVETLRSIAEITIWGDQHDQRLLDFFLENNLLPHFTQILQQRSNRRGDVAIQVLQSISMLIQNIQSKTAIFALFSKNYINQVVSMRFDIQDDEVLGHYTTLLKSISLKLDSSTVQFFFDSKKNFFPLYTEAIKLFSHRDGMVRAAVRTLTLKVYAIQDPALQRFIISQTASHFFSDVALYVADSCQALDRLLPLLNSGTSTAVYNVDSSLAEVEDLLSYCNDILCTGSNALSSLMLQCLWESFALPVIVTPLVLATSPDQAAVQSQPTGEGHTVQPVCALHVLERLLHVMSHTPFVDLLAALLCPDPSHVLEPSSNTSQSEARTASERVSRTSQQEARTASGGLASTSATSTTSSRQAKLPSLSRDGPVGGSSGLAEEQSKYSPGGEGPRSSGAQDHTPERPSSPGQGQPGSARAAAARQAQGSLQQPSSNGLQRTTVQGSTVQGSAKTPQAPSLQPSAFQALFALHEHSAAFRGCFLDTLAHGDGQLVCAAVRVLAAMLQSKAVSSEILDAAGLLPVRRRRHEALMDSLTGGGTSDPSSLFGTPQQASSLTGHSQARLLNEPNGQQHSGTNSSRRSQENGHSPEQQAQSQHATALGPFGKALFQVLQQPQLPSSCMWQIAWLLSQLLVQAPPDPAQLTPASQQLLDQAVQAAQAGLVGQLQGMWCDALPLLVAWEWGHAHQALTYPPTASTTAAVQAWLQALQVHELQQQAGLGGAGQGISLSAQAAKHAVHAVHTFVALAQLQQIVQQGSVSASTPLGSITEARLRSGEVHEGAATELQQAVPCSVAFSRGQERSVLLAVRGMPQADPALHGAAAQQALAKAAAISTASVMLANSGQEANTGVVISLAPLLGADPSLDRAHPRWLHIHVRPPARGLARLLRVNSIGEVLSSIGRQLVDGHWVLCFATPQQAQHAQEMISQQSAMLRTLYGEAVLPMLHPPQFP